MLDEQNIVLAGREHGKGPGRRRPTRQPTDAGAGTFFPTKYNRIAIMSCRDLGQGWASPFEHLIGKPPERLREDAFDSRSMKLIT